MKRLLTFLLLVLVGSAYAQKYEPIQIDKIIGEDTLSVVYGDTVIYLMVDQLDGFDDYSNFQQLAFMPLWNGQPLRKNQYVALNGERKHVRFVSSNKHLLEFVEGSVFVSPGFARAKEMGRLDVYAIFDEQDTLTIPITVDCIGVESNWGEDPIIEFIGKPGYKRSTYLRYNTDTIIDHIRYNTADLVRGLQVRHWMYHQYPGAILILDPIIDRMHCIVRQPAWQKVTDRVKANFFK